MNLLSKKQLRNDESTLRELICRLGNLTLMEAHDSVSVELDYQRGSCIKKTLSTKWRRYMDRTSLKSVTRQDVLNQMQAELLMDEILSILDNENIPLEELDMRISTLQKEVDSLLGKSS